MKFGRYDANGMEWNGRHSVRPETLYNYLFLYNNSKGDLIETLIIDTMHSYTLIM